MRKVKILGVALSAVLAFSVLAVSTASAKHTWWVKNAVLPLGTTKSVSAETQPGTEWRLTTEEFSVKVVILCKKIKLTGTIYNEEPVAGGGLTGRDKGVVEFSECKVDEPAGCTVEEPIKVPPAGEGLTFLVEYGAKKIGDAFLPAAGSDLFATLKIKGTFCVASGTFNVEAMLGSKREAEGGVIAEISPEGSSVTKEFIFPCTPIKEAINWKGEKIATGNLLFKEKPAEFCGKALVSLVSKEEWDVK